MRRLVAVGLSATLGWWGGATPAGAADADRTCDFRAEFTIDPGLSLAPGAGTFTSYGETGRVICGGGPAGLVSAEGGAFGAEGRYGTIDPDGCTGGEGTGVQSFWVAGPAGPAHVVNPIRFVFRVVSDDGVMAGRFEGEQFSGTFGILPLEGDCVTGPVTRVLLRGRGALSRSAR